MANPSNPKLAFIKVKLCSLADEQRTIRRIIRQYQKKRRTESVQEAIDGMHCHRVAVVRREARSAHLAYAIMRGRSIDQVERNAKTEPPWYRVTKIIERYGTNEDRERLAAARSR